jgi:hypothetical protein
VALTDDELLDFEEKELADYDRGRAVQALRQHGEIFRSQLVAARWIHQWADRLMELPALDPAANQAFVNALLDVAAHLRQGDFLPGSAIYKQTVGDSVED